MGISELQLDRKSKSSDGDVEKKARTAFLFDLDGTLVDSVYQHVLAWREALEHLGIDLSVWRIHRRIGMSGGLLVNGLLREIGRQLTKAEATRLGKLHEEVYQRFAGKVRPLPGASELLAYLSDADVPWAIATSGRRASARPMLELFLRFGKAACTIRCQKHFPLASSEERDCALCSGWLDLMRICVEKSRFRIKAEVSITDHMMASSIAEPCRSTRFCLCGFFFPASRRRIGFERMDKAVRDSRNFLDRGLERGFVCL